MSCELVRHPKSAPRATFVFGIGVLFIVTSLCIVFRDYGYDDPYITFQYAQNLIQGNGFVYNVGEPVLSTTTPGYALLLATVGLIFQDIPLLGNVLSAVGLGLGAIFFYLWAYEARQPFVGWIAGPLLLTFPLLVSTFGSEMCLYIGFLLGGLCLHVKQRFNQAMVLIALATLLRPDGVIAAGLVVSFLFFTQRRIPWKPILFYVLVLLPWIAYGTWFFGSPIPATLFAKQAQGQMAISDSFVWGARKMLVSYVKNPSYWSFLPLGAIGGWQIITHRRKWLLLLVWTGCYFVGYTVLGVSRYFWYYAPLVPGVMLSVAVGLDWVRTRIASWQASKFWQWGVTLLLLASMLWPNFLSLRYISTHPDRRLTIYRHVGQWMDANLPTGASVGMLEVGVMGYYAHRRVIDFAGLIQPYVAMQMSQKTTYQDTALWAVQQYHPDYLALNSQWFPDWQDTVLRSCLSVYTFAGSGGYKGELVVYECNWEE